MVMTSPLAADKFSRNPGKAEAAVAVFSGAANAFFGAGEVLGWVAGKVVGHFKAEKREAKQASLLEVQALAGVSAYAFAVMVVNQLARMVQSGEIQAFDPAKVSQSLVKLMQANGIRSKKLIGGQFGVEFDSKHADMLTLLTTISSRKVAIRGT